MENISVDADADLKAVVIEACLDKRKGPTASVIVKNGRLRIGQEVKVDGILGKVRNLQDDQGQNVSEAQPGDPVEIMGLRDVPPIGALLVSASLGEGKELALFSTPAPDSSKILSREIAQREQLKVVLKADVKGSLETILANLSKEILVVYKDVGDLTASDIALAKSTEAVVLTFNVSIPNDVRKLAEEEKVIISNYDLVHELVSELKEVVETQKSRGAKMDSLGRCQIIAQFEVADQKIAGCKVIDGEIKLGVSARLIRDENVLGEVKITSLKKFNKSVSQVQKGEECGVIFTPNIDFKIGDIVELLPSEYV